MSEVEVPISVYHNEDLAKDYVLRVRKAEFALVKKPTLDQTDLRDITGATFEAVARFGSRELIIGLNIDVPTSRIQFRLEEAALLPFKGKSGVYDLLMTQSGVTKRLWGGPFTILVGVT